MSVEPQTADPEDVASKHAAAPGLKISPEPEWVIGPDGAPGSGALRCGLVGHVLAGSARMIIRGIRQEHSS